LGVLRVNAVDFCVNSASRQCETQLAAGGFELMLPIVSQGQQENNVFGNYLVVLLNLITVHDHVVSVSQSYGDKRRGIHRSTGFVGLVELLFLDFVVRGIESASFLVEITTFFPEFGAFEDWHGSIVRVDILGLHMLGLVVFLL